MGHVCDKANPRGCIKPNGSYCATLEGLLPPMRAPRNEVPSDPIALAEWATDFLIELDEWDDPTFDTVADQRWL